MKKFLAIYALSAALVCTSIMPAAAFTRSEAQPGISSVEQVQMRRDRGRYQGYQGTRERRPGFRRHSDGFWYPLAAFGADAAIGGAIRSDRRDRRHVAWCADRYRSYRVADNTYRAPNGMRRQCISP